ncbi:MAG TPA: DNA polymerase III subunit epsilon [Xanthomonadaceae bacterium]|nr:DNA polymerase III subunit epsilon [Xanthomonadaceae bacterium]
MRQIVLDTETTGLSWDKGNRVVEIGCVELVERRPTGRTFHRYLNPEREFEPGAQEVTGLTLEFLADKPKFAEVVDEFLLFIDGAELVIHNAAFDLGFLDAELSRCGPHLGRMRERCGVEDSLELARQRYPGQRNSLDALCRRLGVDNAHRQLHGALLDAQLLAEVYLALTSGQGEIGFGSAADAAPATALVFEGAAHAPRPLVLVGAEELASHEARLAVLRRKAGRAVWDAMREAEESGAVLEPA